MSKTILVHQELYPEQIKELKELASDYQVVESLEETNPEDVEIIIGWSEKLTEIAEREDTRLKWVQYAYAGVNKLPLKLFSEKDILLTSGSGIHAYSVSETAIGLLLGMTREIVKSAKDQENERWNPSPNLYELNGKSIMIVGAGKIGVQLGRLAKAFGMHTIGINRSGREIENMDEQYVQEELEEVIHKADIVVNILPLTNETEALYDKELFQKMKDDVVFINVGRGESVVTADLIEALDSGKVRCAGLDVFEEEPLPKGHPLWQHDKVLMTPHIAGNVESYPKYIYPIFKENFKAYLAGEELPRNLVELEEGY
ncbi:MAG TPA: NAD(P)-dependent oxidoreductase [Atopostipes sp.]|nr:NAD(P)-dependent oxidoreductase [Atopostipes sp.]